MDESIPLRLSRVACRQMTRHHAKTFYFASHVLPRQKRADAYTVYAFCRHADDEVDLAPDEAARTKAIARLRILLRVAYGSGAEDAARERALPWLPAFAETIRRRAIPKRYFEDLITGVELDRSRVRIATWEELDRYCYLVAGVVGLIMVHVLTAPAPELLRPAQDLGTAMQLTNILRDVGEDLARDRVYLPAEELARHRLGDADLAAGRRDDLFRALMREQIDRARDYYRAAEPGIRALPNDGSRYCARLMSTIYSAILIEIERADYEVYRRRQRVALPKKVWLAAQAWLLGR
ncbi:MAG: phytoene/squalene synthase family protein [Verrucomicrobiota bacterium]